MAYAGPVWAGSSLTVLARSAAPLLFLLCHAVLVASHPALAEPAALAAMGDDPILVFR